MLHPLQTFAKKLLADTHTPVGIYLKLRDVFAQSILLESLVNRQTPAVLQHAGDARSFICCDPIASFEASGPTLIIRYPGGAGQRVVVTRQQDITTRLEAFLRAFPCGEDALPGFRGAALYGYCAYDAVPCFEDISLTGREKLIPDICYRLYRYVIIFDHLTNEIELREYVPEGQKTSDSLAMLEGLIQKRQHFHYPFTITSPESSNYSDTAFLAMIQQAQQHCFRGDVFQLVLSRRFTRNFHGDEFQVYRALRTINPSPYLFYFDYGNFRLFGSSPEAQLRIENKEAALFPIAGTYRRTGDVLADEALSRKLAADKKENAEHVMLVDLARNDLSKNADEVSVVVFREIQQFSHVIHLVSKVSGRQREGATAIQTMADTFPAGTLSGAPKYRAMQLIDQYENVNRSFYGGTIGYFGLNGSCNHAIMIRTFLSKNNQLICQAGAGIVAASVPENELQEVANKLEALRSAVLMAEKL